MTQKQILLFLKVAEVTACNFFVKHFQLYTQKVSKSFLPTTKKRDVDCGDVSAGMLTKHLTVVSLTAWKVSTLVELKKSPLSVKLSRVLFIALPFRVHVTVGLGYQPAATHWNATCWSYITFMLGPAMLIVPFSEKDRGEFRSRGKPISDLIIKEWPQCAVHNKFLASWLDLKNKLKNIDESCSLYLTLPLKHEKTKNQQ